MKSTVCPVCGNFISSDIEDVVSCSECGFFREPGNAYMTKECNLVSMCEAVVKWQPSFVIQTASDSNYVFIFVEGVPAEFEGYRAIDLNNGKIPTDITKLVYAGGFLVNGFAKFLNHCLKDGCVPERFFKYVNLSQLEILQHLYASMVSHDDLEFEDLTNLLQYFGGSDDLLNSPNYSKMSDMEMLDERMLFNYTFGPVARAYEDNPDIDIVTYYEHNRANKEQAAKKLAEIIKETAIGDDGRFFKEYASGKINASKLDESCLVDATYPDGMDLDWYALFEKYPPKKYLRRVCNIILLRKELRKYLYGDLVL